MNWGYKILLVYVVFIAGILFMVFRSSGEKTDLVTSDYYAQELKFQEKIDQEKNTHALSAPIRYQLDGQQLSVLFPADFKEKQIKGVISIYCPADQKLDTKQNFDVTDAPVNINLPAGIISVFELHVTWSADGVEYFFKSRISR